MADSRGADKAGDGRAAGRAERAAGGRVIIKKYANRRLYNTARSSYVTLDDLARMVRAGEDFAVFDAKTGEDITRSVLTQIIVEEEAGDQNMLPTKFLRELIRLYGDPLQGMVPGYLDATMEAFSRNQEQLRRAFAGNPALANFEQLARSNMELFERSLRMFAPFGPVPGGQAPGGQMPGGQAPGGPEAGGNAAAGSAAGGQPAGNPPAGGERSSRQPDPARGRDAELGDDLDALQKQLREMQAQLERLSRSKG